MTLTQLWRKPEFKILIVGCLIMFFSFINLLFIEEVDFVKSHSFKQLFWIIIATFLIFVITRIRLKTLKDISIPIYILSLILLILVLFVGEKISGSRSWLKFGNFLSFQPSELAKIAFIFIIAKFYSELGTYSKSYIIKYLLGFAFFIFPFLLITIQPDFGSAFMLFVVSLSIIFSFSYNKKILVSICLIFISPIFDGNINSNSIINWH